ncbi:MAG: hypothetical protein ACOCRK_02235 [bacterium]
MTNKGYVEWQQVKEDNSSGNVQMLWFKKGNTYEIRPLYKPVPYYRYCRFINRGDVRTAITADPDSCPVRESHSDLDYPQLRYFFWAIDRGDDNKIKVVDAPKSVLAPIKNRAKVTGKNPGGSEDGMDFVVEVKQNGKQVNYQVTYKEDTPLTDDEKAEFKKILQNNKNLLLEKAKPDSPAEIEKKLFGSNDTVSDANDTANSDDMGDTANDTGDDDDIPLDF